LKAKWVVYSVLLGIFCTVVVSCLLAFRRPVSPFSITVPTEYQQGLASKHLPAWDLTRWKVFGAERTIGQRFPLKPIAHEDEGIFRYPNQMTRPDLVPVWGESATKESLDYQFVLDDGRGWPFLALRSAILFEKGEDYNRFYRRTPISQIGAKVIGGIRVSLSRPNRFSAGLWDIIILPYRPIAIGFLLDVAFYSLIWLMIIAGYKNIRYMAHHHKGRCIMCGFDLRGSNSGCCPECGWGYEMSQP